MGINRLSKRQPDGGARDHFGTYQITCEVSQEQIRGEFHGTTIDGERVGGPLFGHVQPRRPLAQPAEVWLKLEDGYTGGAMWQNRVFFKGTLKDGPPR